LLEYTADYILISNYYDHELAGFCLNKSADELFGCMYMYKREELIPLACDYINIFYYAKHSQLT